MFYLLRLSIVTEQFSATLSTRNKIDGKNLQKQVNFSKEGTHCNLIKNIINSGSYS